MSCKLSYIYNNVKDIAEADRLNALAIDTFQQIADSGLFSIKDNSFVVNKEGTKKRVNQDTFINNINTANNIVTLRDNIVVVNVSPLFNQQDNNQTFDLTKEQQIFAKKNTIEQSFFHGKPYQKSDGSWSIYKIKNGIKSSIEGALKGFRTQTTRSVSQQEQLFKIAENQGLLQGTIKGTIVWMEDMGASAKAKNQSPTKGQGGWFRITSEFYTPNKEDFNAYENWEDNVWNDRSSEYKIGTKDEWKSVRFEKIEDNIPEDLGLNTELTQDEAECPF